MNIRKIIFNAETGIELCRKLSGLFSSCKSITENYEELETKYKFMKMKVDFYENVINKQYKQIDEIINMFGNPCPDGEWTPCSAEWVENEGWVRVEKGATIQYFKVDKIEHE